MSRLAATGLAANQAMGPEGSGADSARLIQKNLSANAATKLKSKGKMIHGIVYSTLDALKAAFSNTCSSAVVSVLTFMPSIGMSM